MRSIKNILIFIVVILLTVALAGMYKFNYLANQSGYDVDGNKILETKKVTNRLVYLNDKGEQIEVLMKGTDVAEVHFQEVDGSFLKAFTGYITLSASGAQYITKDKRFTFWSKGNEATIFDAKDNILFTGKRIAN